MYKILLLVFLLSNYSYAISLKSEQLILTKNNIELFGFKVKITNKDAGETCKVITLNKHYKSVEQLGMFLEIRNTQQKVIFTGLIAGRPNQNTELINYNFCYQSMHKVQSALVAYGYKNNELVTAFLETSSELISP